ncbi:hypothetical protein NUW58_g10143 [Xylaria curta]|uniref:Uncharacterized protein n=1 Tax=Xylaria curta TaxID=42375 RepID=A0ACC1MP46_9PEZI|nr:hypothetical protein NUW58_g10143 [Xylaria curta]
MAEPLTIIGAVAAVSQVTGEFVKLTTKLRHYLKVISRAPKEAQAFLLETSNFTGLLNFFADLADRPVQGMRKRERRARESRVSGVKEQGEYICAKMEYLVDRFAKLAKQDMTQLESLLERIKYLLDKPDIEDLRLAIQSATIHLNAMSTLLMWEQEPSNGPRRQLIREQLGNLLPMAKKADDQLAEHQRQHGSTYEDLQRPFLGA